MFEQDKIVTITKREQKYILEVIKAYKKVLEQGYNQLKKQKPHQSLQLSAIVVETNKVDKIIKSLKEK